MRIHLLLIALLLSGCELTDHSPFASPFPEEFPMACKVATVTMTPSGRCVPELTATTYTGRYSLAVVGDACTYSMKLEADIGAGWIQIGLQSNALPDTDYVFAFGGLPEGSYLVRTVVIDENLVEFYSDEGIHHVGMEEPSASVYAHYPVPSVDATLQGRDMRASIESPAVDATLRNGDRRALIETGAVTVEGGK